MDIGNHRYTNVQNCILLKYKCDFFFKLRKFFCSPPPSQNHSYGLGFRCWGVDTACVSGLMFSFKERGSVSDETYAWLTLVLPQLPGSLYQFFLTYPETQDQGQVLFLFHTFLHFQTLHWINDNIVSQCVPQQMINHICLLFKAGVCFSLYIFGVST